MRLFQLFVVALLLCVAPASKATNKNTLVFDGSVHPISPLGEYTQALLTKAYQRQGISIEFAPMPLARSFVEANNGRIDGLRARVETVAEQYANLIPVGPPLFQFQLILIADRRACGLCEISQLKHLATVKGMVASEQFLSGLDHQPEVFLSVDLPQAMGLLKKRRVDGVLVPSTMLTNSADVSGEHFIKIPLVEMRDFHYLHVSHGDLATRISAELHQIYQSGEQARLAKAFNIHLAAANAVPLPKKISAISSLWQGYTDGPTATYWQILQHTLGSDVHIDSSVTNWKRAKALFYRKETDMLVGAYAFEAKPGTLLSSSHIDYELPVVAIGSDGIRLRAQLAGQQQAIACYLLGYDFSAWLPEAVRGYEASELDDCFRMLESGRVDMVVDYESSLWEDEKQRFSTQQVRGRLPVFMVFHDTPQGRALRDQFDAGFRKLVASGQARALYPSDVDYDNAQLVTPLQD